jgi:hypothetical protein
LKYELLNCRPCPAKLAPILRRLQEKTGVTYTSLERTQSAVNFARSHGCTLSSQAELYDGWIHHRPGFNPANPPGRSTHERRSDGVAYAGPAGRPLFWWQLGIDNTNSPALCAAARDEGWIVTVTYPGSSSEAHHVNLRKRPHPFDVITVLKRGDKGGKVKRFTAKLANIPLPNHHDKTYLDQAHDHFTEHVEEAVKKFQGDFHLKRDGVVGKHTRTQIRVSWRKARKDGKDA